MDSVLLIPWSNRDVYGCITNLQNDILCREGVQPQAAIAFDPSAVFIRLCLEVVSINDSKYPPLNNQEIHSHLKVSGLNSFVIRVVEKTGSTNDEVKNNFSNRLVVVADEQTQGRGVKGSWASPKGKNIYMTVGYEVSESSMEQRKEMHCAPLVVGLVLSETLYPYIDKTKHTMNVKWANDILVDQKKLSGVLIEKVGNRLIIGIGVNVHGIPPEVQNTNPCGAIPVNAISMEQLIADPASLDRNRIIAEILTKLEFGFKRFIEEGFAPFIKTWKKFEFPINTEILISGLPNTVEAKYLGISDKGALITCQNGKEITYEVGSVSIRTFCIQSNL